MVNNCTHILSSQGLLLVRKVIRREKQVVLYYIFLYFFLNYHDIGVKYSYVFIVTNFCKLGGH